MLFYYVENLKIIELIDLNETYISTVETVSPICHERISPIFAILARQSHYRRRTSPSLSSLIVVTITVIFILFVVPSCFFICSLVAVVAMPPSWQLVQLVLVQQRSRRVLCHRRQLLLQQPVALPMQS